MTLTCQSSRLVTRSFTLIEMLAVLMLIAMLVGLSIGGTRLAWRKSQEAAIKGRMEALVIGLEQYRTDWGYYPIRSSAANTSDLDFDFPFQAPPAVGGKAYLQESTEPYRQSKSGGPAFKYKYPGDRNPQKYDLYSLGVDEGDDVDDNANGNLSDDNDDFDDDLTNWTRN